MSTLKAEETGRTSDESTTGATDDPGELPLDEVFDILSNERRRRVIRYLQEDSASTTLGDLAEHIAAIENGKPERALSSSERKRVYICLYQCHLPKMDDTGVVEFDEDRKSVEVGETIEQVTAYLPGQEDTGPEERDLKTAVATFLSSLG